MTTKDLLRLGATGLLVLTVAACGGGASGDADGSDVDTTRPEATTAVDGTIGDAVDPNEPEDVGAIVYEEDVPVPGTTLNACELITTDDVKAAFAAEGMVATGALEMAPTVLSPGRNECTYEGAFGRLLVEVTPEDGANLYDAAYGAYDGLEAITGLGDGAFWSDKNHRGFVWQGRVTAMFTIFASGDLTGVELTRTLGEALVGKL
jgi:hypothetical protein